MCFFGCERHLNVLLYLLHSYPIRVNFDPSERTLIHTRERDEAPCGAIVVPLLDLMNVANEGGSVDNVGRRIHCRVVSSVFHLSVCVKEI